MAKDASYVVQYRRKREGRTDYKKRLELLKSRKPRLVVRKTNKHVIVQLVDYVEDGDHVAAAANSGELKKYGWKYSGTNTPAAYLTGYLCGKRALQKNKTEAVLDIGLQPNVKGSRVYSALKGALDAGMKIPAGEEAFPTPERISGRHIAEYASKTSKPAEGKCFSNYFKTGADPKKIPENFQEVKDKIDEEFSKKQ